MFGLRDNPIDIRIANSDLLEHGNLEAILQYHVGSYGLRLCRIVVCVLAAAVDTLASNAKGSAAVVLAARCVRQKQRRCRRCTWL